MVNSNATMANVTNAKKSKGSGKSRDVHRGNFSAYQRELDSIIKDLKDTNDPKPNKNPVRNKAASEACVKQRYKSSKTPEAKPRRKHGSENAKLKPTLNPVQLEKLESTAFAALQVIQNTVVSIDKLQEEDIYKEGDESVVAENTTCESWYGVEKWQKGTFHSNYQVSRALESKRRNTVEDSKTNPQIPDQRGITAIGLGDLKPFKNGKSTEQHKTFKHGKRGEEIFQNGQRKGVDDNLNIQEMPNKMNDHINTGGIAAEPQLQSTTVSTQPISHTERGNLVAEARSNARLKTNQSNFQKSIASSSLRSSGKQMISTRTPIDGDTGRSNPKQSGSNTIHNQQLIESSTQTDVNRAELDASTDITYPDQTYLPRGLLGRETEGSKVSVASDGNELQRGNAESYLSRMNDGDGQKDLQEELDKLKEGNEDLERQLRETIDFEVQAMKAYIRLVKQHRQLKRKLQERSESTKAKTMMPEGPKSNGRIQTNGGSHEVDMVGVCEAKGYLPSPDANQNRHQLQTSNGMSAMSTEQDDEGDIVLRCKSEHGTVDTDGDSYAVSAEIVGGRYPWQQDVMTQCGRKGTRNVSIQTELTEVCERCYTERVVKGDNSSSILNRVFRRSKLSKSQSSEFKPIGNDLSFLPASRHASISVPSTGRPLVDIRGIHDSRDVMGLSMPNINTADSLTPSPFPSPLPSPDVAKKQIGRDVDSANPTVVLSYHPDDSDSLSGINAGSHDDSSGSVTSNGSSLRVPSPELLQTIKTSYPKHLKIEPEEQGEDEETVPPPSYRRQRRDAVISQVAPSAQDMGSEEHELNNYKPDSPPQATRNSTTPQMDFLVPTVSRKQSNEHRASIMSEASFTLQSVAAKHVQGFIESSVQGLDNHVASEEVQDSKKKIAAMLRKKFGKQEKSGMGAIISNFKRHDQDELEYAIFKDKHWKDFIESGLGRPIDTSSINSEEYKRREKVWEVFRSECAYLVDHILVLKEIFQERLRWLQCEDHLMHIEIVKLFANVDELCTVSANLCWDLVNNLSSRLSEGEFGQADAIVAAFATFESQVCPAFSSYCMNYSGALLYLESLKKQDDFNEFCKICEQDSRCKRLQLTDLLITPIQRITKYTLLLRDIRKCTSQTSEKELLDSTITSVESAIGDLEGKVEWLANFERVRELQQMISWPPVEEIDSKLSGLVPDFLKSTIAKKSRDVVWFSTKRSLTHEGHLQVFENGRLQDVYVFLFDDMLLITRMRRTSFNKKKSLTDNSSPFGQNQNSVPKHRDGYNFTVCKPPFPLDRLEIVDVDAKQAMANGIKHCFVLVQLNRYGQVHTLFALSAPSEAKQQTWLGHLRESKTKWIRTLRGDSKSKDDKDRKKTL